MNNTNKTYEIAKVCKRCKRMFQYQGFGHLYCEICKQYDMEDFEKVRDYIYKHGMATMFELNQAVGVEIKYIEQYLREGRLEIPEDSKVFIHCEICNTEIRSGRYCMDCAIKMAKDFHGVIRDYEVGEKPVKSKQDGKMRFIGNRDPKS